MGNAYCADTVSIYTIEGCETVKNCHVIVVPEDPNLLFTGPYYSITETGSYQHLDHLACIAQHNTYKWFHRGDITDQVEQWLMANSYTWPLATPQLEHFLLTFL